MNKRSRKRLSDENDPVMNESGDERTTDERIQWWTNPVINESSDERIKMNTNESSDERERISDECERISDEKSVMDSEWF